MSPDCPAVEPLSLFQLDGRVAIVTGASSGLGGRFARVLAAAGAEVVLAARRRERIEALAAELPGAIAVPTDLLQEGSIDELVDRTLEEHGRIDILVNNAGVTDNRSAVDEPADRFREVLETNLTAPFLLARRVASSMIDRSGSGSIVNVASVNGILASRAWPQTSYGASKGGLVNLTRELARQWAEHGIRVNALAPGYFETEMTSELFDERGREWVARHTPLGRAGAAHELDGALLFLAGEGSSFVTGQLLLVDGGWTII